MSLEEYRANKTGVEMNMMVSLGSLWSFLWLGNSSIQVEELIMDEFHLPIFGF